MNWIIQQVASPIFRRLGTGVAGFLGGQGMATDDVSAVMNGITILGLFAWDLGWSYANRKKLKGRS